MPDKLHRDSFEGAFQDAAVYDPVRKSAVSVRDGVIEYLGLELNLEPADKMFTVYRSPATIANAAMAMPGICITDEHVTLDLPPPSSGGVVSRAEMIDTFDPLTKTSIAIRNDLDISDTLALTVESGKRELSLGYRADLIPHDEYDFEQTNIRPHHLAVVPKGRCGPMCSFLDKKPDSRESEPMPKLHKAFCDQEGAMNLQQIVELATALPEAIKSVPVDQLQELLPALQQIVEAARGVLPGEEEPTPPPEPAEPPMEDEMPPTDEEKEKPAFSDADVRRFTDRAIKAHGAVIEKARNFLPEDYKFADKSTAQIMRDAIATVDGEKFNDAELPLAFKLLKKPANQYREFSDTGAGSFVETFKDKEL